MAEKWLYQHEGKIFGPISTQELFASAHLGFLKPGDLVRRSDDAPWKLAESVEGLFVAVHAQSTDQRTGTSN